MAGKVIRAVDWALRLTLGAIFLYAGALHAWDTQGFFVAIQHYQILPPDAAMVLAVWLPWVEIFAAIGLFVARVRLGAIAAVAGMLCVFIVAIASAQARGLDISCGCFREAEAIRVNFPELIARDAAMLAAALVLWFIESARQRRALTAPAPHEK